MYGPELFCPCFARWWGGLLFGLSCRFIPTTGWSVCRTIPTAWWSFRITRGQYGIWCLLIELRWQSALWVTLGWALEAVFFSGEDISPSVDDQVLVCL